MKPDVLKLIEQCVNTGTKLGLQRAYKHDDHPSVDEVQWKIEQAVIEEFYEWFIFEERQ